MCTKNSLKIANLTLENPFIMAPLAGITDAPMRSLCKKHGAALVYSEMVSGKGLFYKDKNTERLLTVFPEEKPIAFQLFGSEEEIIYFSAKTLAGADNQIFDINMGCPVPKVVKNGEGSALIRNPDKVYSIVESAVRGAADGAAALGIAPKPVTAKIRMGFDERSINAVEVAKAIEAAGGSAVAVHGRTREQYYNGQADWDIIKAVKEAVNISVIGNGDIFTGPDAIEMMRRTGCDMVMMARGALGNPWIFEEANYLWRLLGGNPDGLSPSQLRRAMEDFRKVDLTEKIETLSSHYEALLDFKGEYAAVREMRKFIGWYLKGEHGAAAIRRRCNSINSSAEYRTLFQELLEGVKGDSHP